MFFYCRRETLQRRALVSTVWPASGELRSSWPWLWSSWAWNMRTQWRWSDWRGGAPSTLVSSSSSQSTSAKSTSSKGKESVRSSECVVVVIQIMINSRKWSRQHKKAMWLVHVWYANILLACVLLRLHIRNRTATAATVAKRDENDSLTFFPFFAEHPISSTCDSGNKAVITSKTFVGKILS